jgi:hypothetical protein
VIALHLDGNPASVEDIEALYSLQRSRRIEELKERVPVP